LKIRNILFAAVVAAAVPAAAQEGETIRLTVGQTVSGELTPNDNQRRSGKYEDGFVIEGRQGQRVELRLVSTDFDAFLAVQGPAGFNLSNDDQSGGSTDSRLVLELPADGAYRVAATSFRPGGTGRYRLEVSAPPASAAVARPEPAEPLAIGAAVTGSLGPGDGRLASGEYTDRYRFTARRGQRIAASVSSTDFDTYLILRRPDGSQDDNDDTTGTRGSSTNSALDTVLAEDGDYVLTVTSYRPNETGKYRLTLAPSPGNPRHAGVTAGPRVLALLVGVSDYGERTSPLPNTDEDARQLFAGLRSAGLLHPASRILTNGEATTKTVSAAFAQAAAQAGPNDLFLFFFSGHGNQLDVERSAAELDGRSETIELYDAAMTDVELGRLFSSVRSRMALVAIDACYAGGFRNLIDRPNVMGLFSSEEDLTSLVASQFKAGGFLSYFLRNGLSGAADDDGDRIVTAGELATYVRRRFRREGDIPATTREDEPNFQNLVIERGGIHIDDAVVRLGAGSQVAAALPRPFPAIAAQPDVKLARVVSK
jgi:hypothetical protein